MFPLLLSFLVAGQSPIEPRYALHSTSDPVATGFIEKMDASGAITIAGHRAVAGAEIVSLRRLDGLRPAFPRDPHLLLANGDRTVGKPVGIEGSFLLFRAEGNLGDSERLRFPLTSCAVLWLRSPETVDRERFRAQMTGERADDQVMFRNGDVQAGVLTGIDLAKGELILNVSGTNRVLLIDRVAAISFSTKLARVRKPAGPYWFAVLTNGTRLMLVNATIEQGALHGQTMYKDHVQIALRDLSALDVYQGKAVYLSDLKPAQYEYRSYLGERHLWVGDRSVHGAELQLQLTSGITNFDKGLGTHGEFRLAYALDGKYKWFESQIGLDPHLGKCGNAIVRVLIDGRDCNINDGKPLTLASGIVPVRADISKAKELKLVVEWGNGGNVGDYINWGDARLIP